ncbi:MAG: cytidylate kinase-like family protein [Deltaproteobacteria bacterium]|jgi:cytidylate kinase|nr:cytidylate kinase-like family protein [Deltaproteobacteria bacterium]
MAIITISRGSYSRGKEVAEKVAAELGYDCLSRDVVLEAAKQLLIPELKLIRALHDAPSILDRMIGGKEKYIDEFRNVLLSFLKKDNVIYHGLAGQFFLKGIPHVLKVRILADIDERVIEEMKRENISKQEAYQIITTDDEERRRWSLHLYGIDTWDPNLYNMVFKVGKLTVDCAVEIIINAIKQPCFQTTKESQQKLSDLALIAEMQTQIDKSLIYNISASNGDLIVELKAPRKKQKELTAMINHIANDTPDVKSVNIIFKP